LKVNTLIFSLGISSIALSQHNFEVYNNGSLIYVEAEAEIHVLGDVHMSGVTGTLENNGLIKTQGNSYSDNSFQQRGAGTYRIENSSVNLGERQKIEGSFAVRGNGSTQLGVDDGSFYNLELANDQGVVYLVNTFPSPIGDYVADIRNDVDYWAGSVYNRIITHDVGLTGAIVPPVNGQNYSPGVYLIELIDVNTSEIINKRIVKQH
jgi:hypothetical protein